MSVLEISHRSKTFESILAQAEADIRTLGGVPANYKVLFLQGGASTQFSMVPMNLLDAGATADYIDCGSWADKAIKEAQEDRRRERRRVDRGRELLAPAAAVRAAPDPRRRLRARHLEQHDRRHAVQDAARHRRRAARQRHVLRDVQPSDRRRAARSDLRRRSEEHGPSRLTIVIVRDDLLQRSAAKKATLPTMLNYAVHADNGSLYNTPPAFAVYALGLVMKWLLQQGGLTAMAAVNERKAARLYTESIAQASTGARRRRKSAR